MSDEGDLTGIGELQALLAEGVRFSGKLTFDGRVRIDGHFEGEIFSDGVLVLGSTAEVRGRIAVGTLIVRGARVWGDVRAERLVELYAPSEVHADVLSRQLFVDKGVVLEGKCTMIEDDEDDDAGDASGAGPERPPAPGGETADPDEP